MCSKKPKPTGQTRAWQSLSKILAPSEICGKLSVDKEMFLIAMVSMGSPGNTSPFIPALSALKLPWEAKASMENGNLGHCRGSLVTAEKVTEVLSLCLGAPDTQGEGILCVIPLLANYLEMIWKWTVILSSLNTYLKKDLEQITSIANVLKDMSDKEI